MKTETIIKRFLNKEPWAKEYMHLVELTMQTYSDYKNTTGDEKEDRTLRKLLADSFNRQYFKLMNFKPKEAEQEEEDEDTDDFLGQ